VRSRRNVAGEEDAGSDELVGSGGIAHPGDR
jgi:hypothetical protein